MYEGDYAYMGSDIQFWAGADTSERRVDIYNLGDGNWKAVKRSYYLTEYGYRFTIQEIETEEELLWECCNDYMAYPQWIEDPQISSVAELLQIYATN